MRPSDREFARQRCEPHHWPVTPASLRRRRVIMFLVRLFTSRRARLTAIAAVPLVAVSALAAVTVPPAAAAPGCSVTYAAPSQWDGGFTAAVSVTNLGDAINGWTLTWSFGAGQQIK